VAVAIAPVRLATIAVSVVVACCTPVSKGYEIHTGDMTCDEANRYVQDAVLGMGMQITGFRVARPGSPGFVSASRDGSRGNMGGTVHIRCDPDRVHIDADQSGIGSEHEFERGIFLSVTGRADLVPEREGRGIGELKKRETATLPTPSTGASAATPPAQARRPQSGGVSVALERLSGFSSVLDFEANLDAVAILPLRVTVTNATERTYEFDPRDVLLRVAGTRDRAHPLTPKQAVARLTAANVERIGEGKAQATDAEGPLAPTSASDLGDVKAASRLIPERALRAARLGPGAEVSGFLYYEAASYDRARITLIDAATGETEGFLVEF